MYNPYIAAMPNYQAMSAQKQEVVRVNGSNGASAYQLPPNSSILLLDETAPIVWLKMTDGAGYPTITAYDIVPHQEPTPVDTKSLEARIARLEELFNEQSDIKQSNEQKRVIIKPAANGNAASAK